MDKIAAYIESGILELYVLGAATEAESQEVARMAAAHEAIRLELDAILAKGALKARDIAGPTLDAAYNALGLVRGAR